MGGWQDKGGGIQGEQINMAVFSGICEKVTCQVHTCTLAYTGQITFYQKTRPGLTGHPVHRGGGV